jgi:hypothetical protein
MYKFLKLILMIGCWLLVIIWDLPACRRQGIWDLELRSLCAM